MRLTKSDLDWFVGRCEKLTGISLEVRFFNGLYHVYDVTNIELICSGKLRECYNYMRGFAHGACSMIR